MAGLIDFLFRRDAQLYQFERAVIDVVASRLDGNLAVRLNAQVRAINKVQRLSNGKEANLYASRRGKAKFDDSLRFHSVHGEALLARVVLSGGGNKRLGVELWMANGRLFSLLFNRPPKDFFNDVDLKSARAEIQDISVFPEVLTATSQPNEVHGGDKLTGWVRDCFDAGKLKLRYQPFSEAERAKLLQTIDAKLPDGYIDLVKQTDGATFGACAVHGLKEVRKLVWPTDNYYLLAEVEGKAALGVKEGEQTGGLYLLAADGGEAEALQEPFQEALHALATIQ